MQKSNVPSIPRSQKIFGRADCPSSDLVGDCVIIRGPKVGNRYQVQKPDLTDIRTGPSVGIIVKKYSSTECLVQFSGPLVDVYSGLTSGSAYWMGSDARLTDVRPSAGVGETLYLQLMGVATDSDEILLNPQAPLLLRG